ncbi:protein of unknown function [Formosa sp. Hel1_31_208]|uniref:DUF4382 domain-containing protein n=1 Tax=Formosa sp. Hel1_31_208 TaxID=1798225 RepID=UPI000879D7BB|nr:DUF4382 domain-containing protein [Formosa sp. Hel1_31_208]SDR70061.1 protein of unknown function [Formosa sp. Hel1_31_208]
MKLITTYKALFYSVLITLTLSSCSKEYETETYSNSALVTIKLTGLPSQFSHVNIEISDIQFQVKADATDADAWISLNTVNMGIHDFCQIIGDRVVTLVDFDEVSLSHIYNLKLILGENNSLINQGLNYDLVMAPELQGATVNLVDKELNSNKIYEFVIEFDIPESIIILDGMAQLRPKTSVTLRQFQLF